MLLDLSILYQLVFDEEKASLAHISSFKNYEALVID